MTGERRDAMVKLAETIEPACGPVGTTLVGSGGIGRYVVTQNLTPGGTDLTSAVAVLPGHILVVEDDASIRDLVVEILEDEGYVVTASGTPAEATRLLDQANFDLVIADGFSTLPDASFSTTADVVQSAGLTPVVLFSAHTHDLGVAKMAGFSDLIIKPFDLGRLVQQVQALLDR